jgi:hypothetical protein
MVADVKGANGIIDWLGLGLGLGVGVGVNGIIDVNSATVMIADFKTAARYIPPPLPLTAACSGV